MDGQNECQELREALADLEGLRDELREQGRGDAVVLDRLDERIYRLQAQLAECLDRRPPSGPEEPLDPPILPLDHRTVVAPPQAVAFDCNGFSPEIVLMARTEAGLATHFWNDRTVHSTGGGWSFWLDHPNTTGVPVQQWEDLMPLVSWTDPQTGRFRVNGFFAYHDQNARTLLGTPHWVLPVGVGTDFRLDMQTPPGVPRVGSNFFPFTAARWYAGPRGQQVGRLNVFGTVTTGSVASGGRRSLREFWWDGRSWNWTDHPSPDEDTISLFPGPGSFTFPENNGYPQAFLFVEASKGGTPSDTAIYLYHWTRGANWRWHDLGRPRDVIRMVSPLAVSFVNSRTGRTEVSVFIAGANRRSRTWQLYERHWNGQDIKDWDDWRSYGSPPLVSLPGRTGGHVPLDADLGFRMTTGVVWRLGRTLRINLFGYTDSFPNTAGFRTADGRELLEGGQLIELWWDGAVWRWGSLGSGEAFSPERQDIQDGGQAHVPLQVSSAVVTRRDSRVHLGVFGSSASGALWERFWDSRTTPSWTWARH